MKRLAFILILLLQLAIASAQHQPSERNIIPDKSILPYLLGGLVAFLIIYFFVTRYNKKTKPGK